MAEHIRKRNVFARHSWENNFYVQRARSLAGHTVMEVYCPGDPQDIAEEAERIAGALERVVVLSSTLAVDRPKLHRRLGISSRPRSETDLIMSPGLRYLRSRAQPTPVAPGIVVDERFSSRLSRCGFDALAECVWSKSNIARRILLSLDWLFDSRLEPRTPAAVVKTAIALESLLILSESEAVTQSLSERAAFILSGDPNLRQQTSRMLKHFYSGRSGIVHGSEKKAARITPGLLEATDRIAVLLCLVIAANSQIWSSSEDLQAWCENQRWGEAWQVKIPFPGSYLRNALVLGQKGLLKRGQSAG
ncbi:MAG: hypothetical protein JXM73_02470 [Anaerolineae bacterium]|nr:hypothetical protein [Anaerolineae bacterium]